MKKLKEINWKEKLDNIKEKTLKTARKIGAKNMIIICAVMICGVAIALNFIIAGTGGKKTDAGYKIDSDYFSALLASGNGDGNGNSTDTGNSSGSTTKRDSYFDTAAYNRDKARDEAIEVLSIVVENETALQEVRDQAGADIAALAANISAEANIEELIKSKGFADCVAIINGDKVSIIVKSDGLLPSEIAQITEIVYEQSGILPTNMNIVEK